jgi:aldose 1-epimerase
MRSTEYGTLPDGRTVHSWRLGEANGILVDVLTYGARIAGIEVPAPGGRRRVALTLPDCAAYLADTSHQGAIAGRFANRIAGARFTLDGTTYDLPANNGPNTLHGGPGGFAYRLWHAEPDGDALRLGFTSPAGDQGFPGTLTATVRIIVGADSIGFEMEATTDAPTVVNLASHCYFNLEGETSHSILDHVVTLDADAITPVDAALIPTGEIAPVAGTPFDFRSPHAIGARIEADDGQLRLAGGYDHNFVLSPGDTLRRAARIEAAGLSLEVHTTQPGMQFYTGNMLKGTPHPRRSGFCVETQHFPDSPNQPAFPSTVLRPGAPFRATTLLRFA